MKHNITLSILIITLFLIEGCAAPGSAIGNLKVQGTLVSSSNNPVPNKEIEFMLPAAYGLGGLDLVMNKPDDFGHKDHKFKVITDKDGDFEANLGERIYHVTFFLLPPLGAFPKRPPAPFLLARFSDNNTEYYAIQTHDGKYKVYSYSGNEIPLSQSLLSNIFASNKEGENSEFRETIGVIQFQLQAE